MNLFSVFIFFISFQAASSADLFVSPSGVDSSDCTESMTPCRQIHFALRSPSFTDGSIVYLNGGGTYEPFSVNSTASVISDSGMEAIIECSSREEDAIQARSSLTLENVVVRNCRHAVYVDAPGDAISLRSCTFMNNIADRGAAVFLEEELQSFEAINSSFLI